jgi:2Fe-2S iron-sulfur cluster protein
MFRLRPDGAPAQVVLTVEGRTVNVPVGASAAAAMLTAGFCSIRETPVTGSARGPYCMIGVCFDCLAEIDGMPNRQTCLVEARPGMQIRRQIRARKVGLPAS